MNPSRIVSDLFTFEGNQKLKKRLQLWFEDSDKKEVFMSGFELKAT